MTNRRPERIGIDLDNTLVDYSDAARHLATQEGMTNVNTVPELRDLLRESENERWQHIQARLYTDGLHYAKPAVDSLVFMAKAQQFGVEMFIVSHKTATTPVKFGARKLRKPALDWLRQEGIVPQLIPENNVFFCRSQSEKVKKVRELNLDWFIDDLGEVLGNPDFPERTVGWWYAPAPISDTLHESQIPRDSGGVPEPLGFSELVHLLEADSNGL